VALALLTSASSSGKQFIYILYYSATETEVK
jgi:hypothetical protein